MWVFVHDLTGTHRDEDFFTTDVTQTAQQVIETFRGRWSISGCRMNTVTFQEVRADLGVEPPRDWIERTVLRAEPCLFGLDSVVSTSLPLSYSRSRRDLTREWSGFVLMRNWGRQLARFHVRGQALQTSNGSGTNRDFQFRTGSAAV